MLRYLLIPAWGGLGFFIPDLAQRFADYKREKNSLLSLQAKLNIKRARFIAVAFMLALSFLSLMIMNPWHCVLIMAFCGFAVFGFFIDYLLRIIANEMLLAALPLCVIYRIFTGGVYSLMGSLGALGLVILLFGGAAALTYLRNGRGGVGMGDVKLAMVAAVAAGFPDVIYFFVGMSAAIVIYCVIGLRMRYLTRNSYFPMCGHIMAGLIISFFWNPTLSIVAQL